MSQESTKANHNNQRRDSWKEARAAIDFWQALEYLTPQSPPAVKVKDSVWEFNANASDDEMPWKDPEKRLIVDRQIGRNKKFQIYSGIVGGNYFIETARRHLGAPVIDKTEMRPPSSVACICINVDAQGIASGQLFVSTVPWAMAEIARASGKDATLNFRGFFGMEGREQELRSKVQDLMVERKLLAKEPDAKLAEQINSNENPDLEAVETPSATEATGEISDARPAPSAVRPITTADIVAITELVFELSGWRPEQQEKWRIQAKQAPEKGKDNKAASQEDLLNSFYAEDLEQLGEAVARREYGAGLAAYLKGEDSTGRVDLEARRDKFIEGVHPSRLPAGCWPAKHPLVTAQQFAVNAVMSDLAKGEGLFSVNGPPGTGKTTMLKDIIAAIVVSRADAMLSFDNPTSAFKKRIEIEDYTYAAYELDARLRGFGIVVSSANNGAVENITKELPGLAAIAEGIDIDCFSMVADSVAAPDKAKTREMNRERWGLFTAVLGSKANRNQFAGRLWFTESQKRPKDGKPLPPPDPLRLRSLPDLINTGEHGALPWDEARRQYQEARRKVSGAPAQLLTSSAVPSSKPNGPLSCTTELLLHCCVTSRLWINEVFPAPFSPARTVSDDSLNSLSSNRLKPCTRSFEIIPRALSVVLQSP
ncbi:hypothetical protein BJN34_22125 [Cupriavidus necator]|uniref:DNA2/NAM7 helicase helicase domain-containing protein n=1 Tax=Cupriavidus necator TaxID=106590 RepID=A0A1U9UVW6_CUPNE|nr:hypothetical protein [Cupriavidus necator]AQV96567.1 hypothetical protein BJN34_22125 [Cupriavidus necator]